MSSTTTDTIVIGLGAYGSAIAYQLARRGAGVIGIDRFAPPHDRGSSHGATRITRLAIGEGAHYVPLVQRSHAIWQELEAAYGEPLYLRTGGLILSGGGGRGSHHGQADFVQGTIDVARRHGIAHEVLGAAEVQARFPQFVLQGDELAYYEHDSGVLKPERCVAVQLAAAQVHGATLHVNEQVLAIESSGTGVTVRTDRGTYSAAHAVLAAGAWLPQLAGGAFQQHLRVLRQVLYWFKPTQPELFASPGCPVFIWMHGAGDEDYFYGFPMVDGTAGVKVATEQYQATCEPDACERSVTSEEHAHMFAINVAGRLRSVTAECVKAAACMYTVSTDSGFIVDAHPSVPNVTVVSACSGHGFKHSAGLGEAIAQRVLGEGGGIDLSAMALSRFARN